MKTLRRIALLLAVLLAGGLVWAWTPDLPRAGLEARWLRAPGDMREVAGTRLHVRIDGPEGAPAVVMIHGFGASLHTWEDWAQGLAGRFRVIRLDLPGAGLSEPDPTGRYTDDRAVEIIAALMDDLAVGRAALVGNSLGGRIAWRFAAARPDRVTKLVLVSPDGFATMGFGYGEVPDLPFWSPAFEVLTPRAMVRWNLEAVHGDPATMTPALVDRYFELLRAPGSRAAWIARMEQTVLPDPAGLLPGIGVPVLLVWGGRDRLIPAGHAADYLALLPDARLVTFPELGHVPQEEAPAETLAPVAAFLAE